jgi:DNA-binding NarL/FixJ family response regulator
MNSIHDARRLLAALSDDELAVLSLTAEGCTDAYAARQLGVCPRTVQLRRAAMRQKLQLRCRADLISFAAVAMYVEAAAPYQADSPTLADGGAA